MRHRSFSSLSATSPSRGGDSASPEVRPNERERGFLELADAMPQIVWTAPPSGGRECHNHRWFEYSGQKSGSGNIRSAIHPDDLPRRDTLWERARSTGESYADEIRLRDASGNYRWHLKRVIPVKGAQGEIIRWIGNCTDIQEHKQFQETLQSLNRRLEFRVQERTAELMEANSRLAETSVYLTGILHTATQAAIFLVDNRGIVRIFNRGAENMLGYAAAEIVDTATVDLFWNSLDLCVQPGEDALDRSISAFREWNFVRKDGAQVPVALGITPMRDSGGKQIGLLGIAIDITERKVLERELHINNEQLREQTLRADMANRAKDQFLATMSHEIRTPLNAIMGIADLLRDSPLNAEQRNYVEIFRRAGSALLALINDLLDFSKIEAGQIELENLEFDVEELFEEVLELTAPKARAKALTLMLRTSPSLPSRVIGDPARIRQVLINLLGNAAKFTHSGEIVLSASVAGDPAGGSMEFSVSDTGIGIPADKTEAIFEDFRQADSTTSRNYGGTGLGLGISRRLVERMGGRLTVTSEQGVGSTFRFTLKFGLPSAANGTAAEAEGKLRGLSALVIDDNSTNRMILVELLSSWGMKCRGFGRPSEALENLRAQTEAGRADDVVLIDCHMDEMDGFEAAERIRTIAPATPVIMLTSSADANDAARRVRCGLAGHAVKPVRRSCLFGMIAAAVGRTDRPEACSQAEPDPGEEYPGQPLRILVAEDLPDNQFLIRTYLKRTPHELTFADNGKAALEAFRKESFDLILMDMRMPVMDGLSATRAIRELEGTHAATPIIALSANASTADIRLSLEAGCQTHLSKPISRSRLLAAIRDHVARVPAPEEAGGSAADEEASLRAEVEALIPAYVAGRKADLAAVSALLEKEDFEAIRTLGHNMKGSGASHGLPEISRIGEYMEAAAIRRDESSVGLFTQDLLRLMETIQCGLLRRQLRVDSCRDAIEAA